MCDSDVDFENEKDPLVIRSLVLVTLLATQTEKWVIPLSQTRINSQLPYF